MCGIAGAIDLTDHRPLPYGLLANLAQALVHRGPDEDGLLERPGIGLASRRLSIVGLADGRQPIANEDKTIWVVFNGELYDFREVRARLQDLGHRFRTGCDTEILPHLYEEYGDDMFEHVRGQFAFALWDQRQRRLILARDRFGICPLFTTRVQTDDGGQWLLFASEIKALLASGLVRAQADPRGLNQIFSFFALPGPDTCFAGVKTLHPGHSLSIQLGRAGQPARFYDRTYWEIDYPDAGQENPEPDEKRLTDQFEEVLHGAVKRRLRADVPVVSYLSGGVDSSLIVAMASRILNRPIPTFSVRVRTPALDEWRFADRVSRHVGAEPTVINFAKRELLAQMPGLIHTAESPVIDTAAAANLLLAEQVHASGYKVALTGEGADEWLGGYPWFQGYRTIGFMNAIPGLPLCSAGCKAYLRWVDAPPGSWPLVESAENAVGGHNVWLMWTTMASINKLRLFHPDLLDRLRGHEPYAELALNPSRMKRWHPLNRGLCLAARVFMAGMLLSAKGDRVAMRSSVETRYPFLDEEVFQFLSRLHPQWKLRGLTEKYLLRRVAERWLPRSIAWRRKAMFVAPRDLFHSAERPSYLDQLLSEASLKKTGYFDVKKVRYWLTNFRRLQGFSSSRAFMEASLVAVAGAQLWHHTFLDGSLADLPTYRFEETASHFSRAAALPVRAMGDSRAVHSA